MGFVNGRTYRFVSNAFRGYALNVYGTNAASTGRNVCLFTNDTADIMQKWVVRSSGSGRFRMHSSVNNNFVLDCSDGALDTSYKNNAHLCSTVETNLKDSEVVFEPTGTDNVYRICLVGHNLYLTATNTKVVNNVPASAIRTSTALTGGTGGESNVYWASKAPSSSVMGSKQEWIVSPKVDGVPESNNPYAALKWRYVFDNIQNCNGEFGYDPTRSPKGHWGIDVICDEGIVVRAPAKGTVYAVGGSTFQHSGSPNVNISGVSEHKSMGYFVVLKMDDLDPVTKRPMYVRFLHFRAVPPVRYGETVSAGKLLGYVGDTGESTAPHLHLDINTKSSNQFYGDGYTTANTINPVNFFPGVSFPAKYYNTGVYE